jgi:hypothetical protein
MLLFTSYSSLLYLPLSTTSLFLSPRHMSLLFSSTYPSSSFFFVFSFTSYSPFLHLLFHSRIQFLFNFSFSHSPSTLSLKNFLRRFSLLHVVQMGSGTHPASYQTGTAGDCPGVKRPGREADHSPQSSAGVKNGGVIPLLPSYVFIA